MTFIEADTGFRPSLTPFIKEYAIQNPQNITRFFISEIRPELEAVTRQISLSNRVIDTDYISTALVEQFKKGRILPLQMAATMLDQGKNKYLLLQEYTEEDKKNFLILAADASEERLKENYTYPKWIPRLRNSVSSLSMIGQKKPLEEISDFRKRLSQVII